MADETFELTAQIANTPEAVIDYVSQVRNRPLFFPSLKSISDVKGDPKSVGTSWKWTFATLGMEFQGTGRCLQHVPGKLYSFSTEGGNAEHRSPTRPRSQVRCSRSVWITAFRRRPSHACRPRAWARR